MVYDQKRQVMVLFGGLEARGSAPVDTWKFDGTQWQQLASEGPPGGRELPILAYDPLRQAIILTGGGEAPADGFPTWKYSNDVWEWNGDAWVEVPVEGTRPAPMIGVAGAYDPRRGQLVQFGGTPDGANRVTSNETWVYGLESLHLMSAPPTQGRIEIHWTGGAAPYQVQSHSDLTTGTWQNEGEPTEALSVTIQVDGAAKFFRVLSLFRNVP